ncbi:hypothetical protein V1227_28880 [Lentzea sp. DG1S-22]|uniref:hypothetical protein n=1 Tax=Lentzea sp. DG1S-22 TaxID=3108822 RepID=UPI002E77CB1F|nr:hypothetical protein [Lentzea sp. DG1S-22]WVH79038.1 hypothetical protein V1227_28880 [Lentzea sp. DG1S-22]
MLTALLMIVSGCSGETGTRAAVDARCGKPTKEELVSSYIDALNANDREAVRQLVDGYGLDLGGSDHASLDNAVEKRVSSFGGRSIRLQKQNFSDAVPYVSTADLEGDANRGAYVERLSMRRPDGRPNWCLSLQDTPSITNPPLPTAGTGR